MKKYVLHSIVLALVLLLGACKKDDIEKAAEVAGIGEIKIFENTQSTDISFANNNVGYLSSGFEYTAGTAMVAKTTDGGNTWTKLSVSINGSPTANIRSVFAHSADHVYITYNTQNDDFGLAMSTDGGRTWKKISSLLGKGPNYYGIHFLDAKIGFACRGGDILKTIDGGLTWRTVRSMGASWLLFPSKRVGYAYSNFASDGISGGELLKTQDGGDTWEALYSLAEPITNLNFIDERTGYAFTFEDKIYKTTDGGTTWQLLNTLPGGLYYASAINGGTIIFGGYKKIYSTTNDFKTVELLYETPTYGSNLGYRVGISPNKMNIVFIGARENVVKVQLK